VFLHTFLAVNIGDSGRSTVHSLSVFSLPAVASRWRCCGLLRMQHTLLPAAISS